MNLLSMIHEDMLKHIIQKYIEIQTMKLRDWIDESKLDWYHLSKNPNALELLRQHPEKIHSDDCLKLPMQSMYWRTIWTKRNGTGCLKTPMQYTCWSETKKKSIGGCFREIHLSLLPIQTITSLCCEHH